MNIKKLKDVKTDFFALYPKGFKDEAFFETLKKHNIEKMSKIVKELFAPSNFEDARLISENFAKTISKSPFISLFEKLSARDMIRSITDEQKDMLCIGLYELLHGNKRDGFDSLVDVLSMHKLSKWTIVTLVPYYYDRDKEYPIKPTTTKKIISFYELDNLTYKPRPSYEFYKSYTLALKNIKKELEGSFNGDNIKLISFLRIGAQTQDIL